MAASLSRQGTSSRIIGGATPSSNPSSGTVPGSITPAPAITLSRKSTQNISNAASGSNPGTGSSVSKMHTMMEPSILRAVQLGKVLRRFGQGLQASSGTNSEHMLSQEATHIDDFISHDWGSGRWEKTLTLWFLYNGTPAMLVSFAAAVLVGILQCSSVGILPVPNRSPGGSNGVTLLHKSGLWCRLLCPVVFATTFIFWQDLRQRLGLRTRLVFVDKFCIDQRTDAQKRAGILGITGFLASSERLIICWTPRYFKRLWCTVEVASWLYLQKGMDSILFMPTLKVLSHVTMLIGFTYTVSGVILMTTFVSEVPMIVVLGAAVPATLPCMHIIRRAAQGLRCLPEQIASFATSQAECFCCTNGHVDPGTGQRLQCDRRLIYRTLDAWVTSGRQDAPPPDVGYGSSIHGSFETGLLWFDQAVRTEFGPAVLKRAGFARTTYKQALIVCVPFTWQLCDALAGWNPNVDGALVSLLLAQLILAFAIFPSLVKLTELFVAALDRALGDPSSWLMDVAATVMADVAVLAAYVVLFFPLMISARSCASRVPFVLWSCSTVCLTCVLYCDYPGLWLQRLKLVGSKERARSDLVETVASTASGVAAAPDKVPRAGHEPTGGTGDHGDDLGEEIPEGMRPHLRGLPARHIFLKCEESVLSRDSI
mmetsp:Transcript_3018/g.8945  ORF Transcript_3018/g.8945 Transcript_3018/m.8945 type:complete len:654 (-) Transcript_3018:121-2082(-)